MTVSFLKNPKFFGEIALLAGKIFFGGMKMKKEQSCKWSIVLFVIFILFTIAVKFIDVRPIGPNGSAVGFAGINALFMRSELNGFWYNLTELSGRLMPFTVVGIFAIYGLYQLIKRKSLKAVDKDIWALAGYFVVVIIFFILFEKIVINYRPIILPKDNGELQASYPSSHVFLTISTGGAALIQVGRRIKNAKLKGILMFILWLFIAVMIIGRLLSGVHWFTDIVGGILLGVALSMFYRFLDAKTTGDVKNAQNA